MELNDQMVTVTYDESSYRQGDRKMVYTLVGTKEQIADEVRESVLSALDYNSHVTGLHIIPTHPANVIRLDKR